MFAILETISDPRPHSLDQADVLHLFLLVLVLTLLGSRGRCGV